MTHIEHWASGKRSALLQGAAGYGKGVVVQAAVQVGWRHSRGPLPVQRPAGARLCLMQSWSEHQVQPGNLQCCKAQSSGAAFMRCLCTGLHMCTAGRISSSKAAVAALRAQHQLERGRPQHAISRVCAHVAVWTVKQGLTTACSQTRAHSQCEQSQGFELQ